MTERRDVALRDRPDGRTSASTGATPGDTATAAGVPVDQPTASTGVTATARSPGDEDELPPLRSALSVLTTLGPPITIVTALMHYFGWARADVQASAMGLDVTMFGYSPQDYIIRSVSTLYVPLLITGAVALAWLTLHRRLVERTPAGAAGRDALRVAGWSVLVTGLVVAFASVTVAVVDDDRGPVFTPLVLAAGAAVAAYGAWMVRATSAATSAVPPWQRALRGLLTGAVITLALFWQMSNYAGIVGRGYVQELVDTMQDLPRAWAYSAAPLGIEAPGVTEEPLMQEAVAEGDARQYRTSGLRLLTRSGGRLFLLHDDWTPQTGTVVLLPDDGTIRWQFSN